MVQMFGGLAFDPLVGRNLCGLADVVVRAHKDEVVGIAQKAPQGLDLRTDAVCSVRNK